MDDLNIVISEGETEELETISEDTEEDRENNPDVCSFGYTEVETLKEELSELRIRLSMLAEDNAELVSDNLTLRSEIDSLLKARASLPAFSARTENTPDKYGGIKEAFRSSKKR